MREPPRNLDILGQHHGKYARIGRYIHCGRGIKRTPSPYPRKELTERLRHKTDILVQDQEVSKLSDTSDTPNVRIEVP